jgi:hypothetical protein
VQDELGRYNSVERERMRMITMDTSIHTLLHDTFVVVLYSSLS